MKTTVHHRRQSPRIPSSSQLSTLSALRDTLAPRRNKSTETTIALLAAQGYQCQWLRVRWTGGVGSYNMMRGNVMRILVSATKSGFSSGGFRDVELCPGIYDSISVGVKRRGFRYGWCLELSPTL